MRNTVILEMTGLEALLCQQAIETYALHPHECTDIAGSGITNEYARATLKRLGEHIGRQVVALDTADEALEAFAGMIEIVIH